VRQGGHGRADAAVAHGPHHLRRHQPVAPQLEFESKD
jgi:hypothetical protein